MSSGNIHSRFHLVAVVLFFFINDEVERACCTSTFQSFETSSKTTNNGGVITRFEETKHDSSDLQNPIRSSTMFIGGSSSSSPQNGFHHQSSSSRQTFNRQVFTNEVGAYNPSTSFNSNDFFGNLFKPTNNFFHHRLTNSGFGRHRGFFSRARSVESPAYSVDSGGQSSSSLSNGIAKLFNIKNQGFYSDLYNSHKLPTTRKPLDTIEDSDLSTDNFEHSFSNAIRNQEQLSRHRSFNII